MLQEFFFLFKRSMFHAPTGGVSHDDDDRCARPAHSFTLCVGFIISR